MHTATSDPAAYAHIATTERCLRICFSTVLFSAVLAGGIVEPAWIFAFNLTGLYLLHTALTARDPVYAVTRRLHLADRLQIWLETLATGALLPVLMVGDLISSLTVFVLSSIGGLLATAAIIGHDALDGLRASLRRQPYNSNPPLVA